MLLVRRVRGVDLARAMARQQRRQRGVEEGGVRRFASDGPGFGVDEAMDKLGEKLVLPPFLEGRRAQIEAGLKAI